MVRDACVVWVVLEAEKAMSHIVLTCTRESLTRRHG